MPVKVVTQVKLIPDAAQASALSATLRTVNEAANWVSEVAFVNDVPREYELRKHTYAELKTRGLGAQAAQHTIKKVRDAYTTLHANLRARPARRPASWRAVDHGAVQAAAGQGRHLQCVCDQAGAHVVGHGPADDLADEALQHRREIEELRACEGDIRDVAHVLPPRLGGGEVPPEQVRNL